MGLGKFTAYSQNFLRDKSLANRLISISDINKDDVIYDIGAGSGVLTKLLARRAKNVIAIEIDSKFIPILQDLKNSFPNITIVNCDVEKYVFPKSPYKVFGNIPFNYTSRILKKLYFQNKMSPDIAYLIMQREAFYKYSGFSSETQLSLLLKPFFEFVKVCEIKNTAFKPVPDVEIVFVKIQKKENLDISIDEQIRYQDFIVYCTTRWKPNVATALNKIFTYQQIKRLSGSLGFDAKNNPLELDYLQWVGLYRYYFDNVIEAKKDLVKNSYQNQLNQQQMLQKNYRSRLY